MLELIGLKIVAIKGWNKNLYGRKTPKKIITPEIVFFDDNETYMFLNEQGEEFHDCDSGARTLDIRKNKKEYENLINSSSYSDANTSDL